MDGKGEHPPKMARKDSSQILNQRRRNDNINKVCVLEGVGEGNFFTENCPKTLFFLGNSMTIKFGNFANFIVRNFVVIWEAPTEANGVWSCDAGNPR